MPTLNELIKESVEKRDKKPLEQVEWEVQQVLEFTRQRVVHLHLYKQAFRNLLLIQKWIRDIINLEQWKQ